jgi:UDP-3-O-[3-hydroxymyristoyl] glucosamine N-acyltransferase
MIDTRFHPKLGTYTLKDICAQSDCRLLNPEHENFIVENIAPLQEALPADLSFLDNKKYKNAFQNSKAGACIVHEEFIAFAPSDMKLLISKTPYKSYALAAQMFYGVAQKRAAGIASTAVIDPSADIDPSAQIDSYAVIGAHAKIGANTYVGCHAVIGDHVEIGKNCDVGAHAVIHYALIGDHVRLYTGVRIGCDGFGFAIDPKGFVKVPQLGRVVIEGYSEIGANTTIDRGTLGDTVIGLGTWIDNLCQIAHNVKLGRGCVLAAQVGIAGSTEIGDFTLLGGQAGVAGHLKIGSQVRIAAQSGVIGSIEDHAEIMGYPAVQKSEFLRMNAVMRKSARVKKGGSHE